MKNSKRRKIENFVFPVEPSCAYVIVLSNGITPWSIINCLLKQNKYVSETIKNILIFKMKNCFVFYAYMLEGYK